MVTASIAKEGIIVTAFAWISIEISLYPRKCSNNEVASTILWGKNVDRHEVAS